MITFEQGVRFLTDYINGDIYYGIDKAREHHNLERALCQFALVRELESHMAEMNQIVCDVRQGI